MMLLIHLDKGNTLKLIFSYIPNQHFKLESYSLCTNTLYVCRYKEDEHWDEKDLTTNNV